MHAGFELPLSLESSAGDETHIFQVNGTLTGAMLLVFDVADGSTLGGGFSAFYGPVHSGMSSRTGITVKLFIIGYTGRS